MSDNNTFGFAKLVPGFDFLQNLAKGAGSGMASLPNLSNWVAPTLSVEDLEKRIDELKSVQFWLEQNSRALAATVQALEVQKMTLATLQGMNFNIADLASAFQVKAQDGITAGIAAGAQGVQKAKETASEAVQSVTGAAQDALQGMARQAGEAVSGAAGAGGLIDPMQWWGALAGQFQQIATTALQDAARQGAMDAAKNTATGLAQEAFKTATDMAQQLTAKGMQTLQEAAQMPSAAASAVAAAAAAHKTTKPTAKPKAATPIETPTQTPKVGAKPAGKTAGKTAAKTVAKTAAKTPVRKKSP